MADGFKHIKVTAADEDDEVIVAGISERAGDGLAAEHEAEHGLGSEAAPEPAPVAAPAAEPTSGPISAAPAPVTEQAPSPTTAPAPAPRRAAKPASADDGYHETTLEDLEGAKMPLAQRIVIVAAIICIIGALVYYFVAMR